ncbi:MAG: hypothetical protein JSV81_03405 [Anaerolineales bacterium]|nr:MAG: hypothetical protein JSV81_03405 [Anaerolineales bacterium]
MPTPLLTTKLYIPPVGPALVSRPRLIERMNAGLHRKLTLVSAPAGFGKTTLLSEWVATCQQPITPGPPPMSAYATGAGRPGQGTPGEGRTAWLSLDEGDNDLARFLTYLVAALQTIAGNLGQGVSAALLSPGAVDVEAVLSTLINEIAGLPGSLVLVLDDYHVIESQSIDNALTFMLEHLPLNMHLVIATRADPTLPLSRLRAGDQMTEIRVADLRFTLDEVAAFLSRATRHNLSAENVAALGTRTEGWIAGLQLAALSMRGLKRSGDVTDFVNRFTGSDRYIQDYLADEVLQQRPKGTKDFLLQTSILDRLSGPLCDAVTQKKNSQAILEALEAANLFIVPLDNERRWYRYHHLFAHLLRQRLQQSTASFAGDEGRGVAELHRRASQWYEENDLEIEAFHHAAAANDVERATRLIEGGGMPLTFRGAVAPVLNWLESLPTAVLDARPLLWVTYASALLGAGQATGVEQRLQAAEAALQGAEPDENTQDLVGRIAATRATLAWGQNQAETIIAQSRRALENLHPDNLPFRTSTTWKLGHAYQLQGDRAAASRAYTQAIAICQASGNFFINILASTGLGNVQEAENQLYLAAKTYRRILQLVGDRPLLAACGAHLGLARVCYEWNDLVTALQHGQQGFQLARHIDSNDAFATCGVFLARLKLAQADVAGADAILVEADQFVRQHNFLSRMPEVAAAQVLVLLRQGNLAAAAQLAGNSDLPISQARVHLAQGDPAGALVALGPLRQQMEAKGWQDEMLKVLVLQAVALHVRGQTDQALQVLGDALVLAEPGGFVRIFVDEGAPMAQLLGQAAECGMMPGYLDKLLAAFQDESKSLSAPRTTEPAPSPSVARGDPSALVEPLSERELEVLQLIAQGLSNREISQRLFLALSTVKGHNRNIFGKLQVQRRTEAVARARELGLL